MKRYRVRVTPLAADNIRDAYRWYLKENPAYAAKWREGIQAVILGLRTLPEAHGMAPEARVLGREVRHVLFGGGTRWRIFFVIDRGTVRVLHVRHGRRDYWRP